MFVLPPLLAKLFYSADKLPKATSAELTMCLHGQPSKLSFLGTQIDERSNHALARIQIEDNQTRDIRVVRMNAPQIGDVMCTYNEACAFDDYNLKALQKAADEIQPLDSSLHKPKEATGPKPHGFL